MQTFSAPMAYIKIGNETAGFVRNITVQEQINRVDVQGLGSLPIQEIPPVSYRCSATVDQFFLSFKAPVVEAMIHRLGTLQEVLDTLTFAEQGFSIMIYKKLVQNFDDSRKMVTSVDPTGQTVALLTPCFIENQNWQLQQQSVASYNVNIRYLHPVVTAEY